MNLDAAVDALSRTYSIGTQITDALGKPPNINDISSVGQRLAWAGNVQLLSGLYYNFALSVPAGADYDLYLYNSTGTTYGEPTIVGKSTTAATGGTEQFTVTAPYTGTYYIVVKRATETTEGGNFTLTSTGPLCSNLTIESNIGGTTNPTPGTYTYYRGTCVNITAYPDANEYFWFWTANDSANNVIYYGAKQEGFVINMTRDYNVTAWFGSYNYTYKYPSMYPLTVRSYLDFDGRVSMSDLVLVLNLFGKNSNQSDWQSSGAMMVDILCQKNNQIDMADLQQVLNDFGNHI